MPPSITNGKNSFLRMPKVPSHGGLVTSTLLEFLVRPALFWTTGIGAARREVDAGRERIVLVVEQNFD